MPDVVSSAKTASTEKYLFVVGFIEGKNFPKRAHTKFVIEAKFDGEQLLSDPVDHNELIEINQELAWEIDKKKLQLHKLQRSCIKANCYAVSETTGAREPVGYLVLDVRSAADGESKTSKEMPLLQSKYQKQKPTITCVIYTELLNDKFENLARPSSALDNMVEPTSKPVRAILDEDRGYYRIESTPKCTSNTHVVKLTLTLVFARNLVKLVASPPSAEHSSQFFFVYKILNNQVTTKPFRDLVSSQINAETTSIRLCTAISDLMTFLKQLSSLEILFCSDSKIIAKTYLDWSCLLEPLKDGGVKSLSPPIVVDQILKLEPSELVSSGEQSNVDTNIDSVIGVQCGLERLDERTPSPPALSSSSSSSIAAMSGGVGGGDNARLESNQQQQVIYQNESTTITVNGQPQQTNETVLNVKTGGKQGVMRDENALLGLLTEEMQLKAAYELQVWKEQREKEFEAHLKKLEAKKIQALAEAFKQHDLERETILKKKIKEYNDLELLLKNSLSEVEKREKKMAFDEAQITRLKADLHRDYEAKLIELREASKRVQEKADHQMNLQKSKIDSLEEEIGKYKRHALEWEKRYADKELEFVRYKEREGNRSEIKLQAEINMLRLEKMELERKLDAQTKAKQHYKEQFQRTLEELTLLKRRDEANARALLKKQQMELDNLKHRYFGSGSDEAIHKKYDKIAQPSAPLQPQPQQQQQPQANGPEFRLCDYNLDSVEPQLRQRINRLVDERECLMRTGAYTTTDELIIKLDRCIQECLREAKLIR